MWIHADSIVTRDDLNAIRGIVTQQDIISKVMTSGLKKENAYRKWTAMQVRRFQQLLASSNCESTLRKFANELEMFPGLNRQASEAQAYMYMHLAEWFLHGCPLFEVRTALGELLRDTTLKGLRAKDLRLPFSSFYVAIPQHLFTIEVDRVYPLGGVYVTEQREGDRWRLHLLLCGVGEKIEFGWDDGFKYLASDWTKNDEDREIIYAENNEILKWITNVIMYMACSEARISTIYLNKEYRRWAKGAKKKKAPRDNRRVTILGVGVQRIEPSKTGKPLAVRTLVMGHYRRVVYGKKRAERRLQWIAPFWRGPELGEISNPIRRMVGK